MSLRFCSVLLSLLFLTASAAAQNTEVFDDPDGKYTMTLPTGWLAIVNQDVTGAKDINIVFKVRENGSLKLRRIDDADPMAEVITYAQKDEEQTLRFLPGYDKISIEKFLITPGRNGAVVTYDYKNNSQPFTGRDYFVRVDEKTIYVLRFRGRKTTLPSLRNQTDAIARSFKLKQAASK